LGKYFTRPSFQKIIPWMKKFSSKKKFSKESYFFFENNFDNISDQVVL
jgi:hypothetical protein